MPVTIYHNPRCSKSRQTLDILNSKNCDLVIVDYLKTPPSAAELKGVVKKLQLSVRDIMRTKETQYQKLELDNTSLSEDELLSFMHQYPTLIERPIVVNGDKACIGRPPENVLNIV